MRRAVSLLLAAALLIGCAAGCETGETVSVWLLAPEDSGSGVQSVEAPVPEGEDAGLAAMRALIDPPDSAVAGGLESPFVEEVECEGVEYAGGTAIVRLSEAYLRMSGYELSEAEGCAALTMLEIPRVNGVRILVNGRPHPEGAQDVLSASDITYENPGEGSFERELTLYFRSDSTGRLAAETRGIVMPEGESVERYVIEELIKGPTQSGLSPVLPDTLELLEVDSGDSVCLLDFSGDFEEITEGSRSDEMFALAAIANSLAASSSVETVLFAEDGASLYGGASLGECRGEYGAPGYAEFTVYVPSNDGLHVEPVRAMLDVSGAYGLDRLLVEYLIGGLDGAGFDSALPPETRVERIRSNSTRCTINFADGFDDSINSAGESGRLMLAALAHTLSANGYGTSELEILADGEPFTVVSANAEDIAP